MPANHARKSAIRRRMEATGENYRQATKAVAQEEFVQSVGWVCPTGEPQHHGGWGDCRPSCPEYENAPYPRRAPQVDPHAEGRDDYREEHDPITQCHLCCNVGSVEDFRSGFPYCGAPKECPFEEILRSNS